MDQALALVSGWIRLSPVVRKASSAIDPRQRPVAQLAVPQLEPVRPQGQAERQLGRQPQPQLGLSGGL